MSLDLTLYADPYWRTRKPGDSVVVKAALPVDQCIEFLEKIKGLKTHEPQNPLGLWSDDTGYYESYEDAYWERLQWTHASSFRNIDPEFYAYSGWNSAIMAFLGTVDSETRVYLYWR